MRLPYKPDYTDQSLLQKVDLNHPDAGCLRLTPHLNGVLPRLDSC